MQQDDASRTFSVVVPAYRSAVTIPRALGSILQQTAPPIEVIVVDDASGDDTLEVAEGFRATLASRRIGLACIALASNGGPSVARNAGSAIASGSHVAFLDADDAWHPTKLAVVDRHLSQDDAAMVFHAYTDAARFDDEALLRHGHLATRVGARTFLVRNPAQTSCVVVRSDLDERFDEGLRYCEDHDLWLRIAERHGALALSGPALTRLGRPQLTAGGASGNVAGMRRGERAVYRGYSTRGPWLRRLLFPVLLSYSVAKHLRSALVRRQSR